MNVPELQSFFDIVRNSQERSANYPNYGRGHSKTIFKKNKKARHYGDKRAHP